MKEALSIRTTPEDARFNRDDGYELTDCWITTFKKLKGGARGGTTLSRDATIMSFALSNTMVFSIELVSRITH